MPGRVEILLEIKQKGAEALGRVKDDLTQIVALGAKGGGSVSPIAPLKTDLEAISSGKNRDALSNVGKDLKDVGKGASEAGKGTEKAASKLDQFKDVVLENGGAVGDLAGRTGSFIGALRSLNPVAVAAGLTVGLMAKAFHSAVTAQLEFQKEMRGIQAIIDATGGRAGVSAEHINKLAESISGIGQVSASSVRQAGAILLTFENISKANFDQTIQASADLAAVLGTDVSNAAQRLGFALESPEYGMRMLRRAGIVLDRDTQKTIKTLVELGNVAAAQGIILEKVNEKVGGAAAAQDTGLAGALDSFGDAWDRMKLTLGDSAFIDVAAVAISGLAAAIDALNDALTSEADKRIADLAAQLRTINREIEKESGSGDAARLAILQRVKKALEDEKKAVTDLGDTFETLTDMQAQVAAAKAAFEEAVAGGDRTAIREFTDVKGRAFSLAAARKQIEDMEAEITQFQQGRDRARFDALRKSREELEKANLAKEVDDLRRRTADEIKARDERTNRLLEAEKAGAAKLAMDSAKFNTEFQKRALQRQLADREITIKEYYDRVLALDQKLLDVEAKGLRERIAANQKAEQDILDNLALADAAAIKQHEETMKRLGEDPGFVKPSSLPDEKLLKVRQETAEATLRLKQIEKERGENIVESGRDSAEAIKKDEAATQALLLKVRELQSQHITFEFNSAEFDAQVEQVRKDVTARMNQLREELKKQGIKNGDTIVENLIGKQQAAAEFAVVEKLFNEKIAAIKQKQQSLADGTAFAPGTGLDEAVAKTAVLKGEIAGAKVEVNLMLERMVALGQIDPGLAAKLREATVEAQALSEETATFYDFLRNNAQSLADNFSGGLAGAITDWVSGVKDADDAFRDFARNFIAQLAQMILKQMIFNAIAGSAFGQSMGLKPVGAATGGYIAGPGTSTSDSIPARLSNGEYVIRAAAVKRYGVGFFEALNRMMMEPFEHARAPSITVPRSPRFAAGGYVSALEQRQESNTVVDLAVVNVDSADKARAYLMSREGRKDLMTIMNDGREGFSRIFRRG